MIQTKCDSEGNFLFNTNSSENYQPEGASKCEREKEEKILNNYARLISQQNKLLTKLSLSPEPNEIQYIDRIRTEANCFIRSLLQELTQLYAKIRKQKRESEQKISSLSEQLGNEKQKYEALKQQFYKEWQETNVKENQIIGYLDKQLESANNEMQILMNTKFKQISQKQYQIEKLAEENIKLKHQIAEMDRLLRTERDYGNDQSRQMKGMQMLLEEYEENKKNLQLKVNIKNKQIAEIKDKYDNVCNQLSKVTKDLAYKQKILKKNNEQIEQYGLKVSILSEKFTKLKLQKDYLNSNFQENQEDHSSLEQKYKLSLKQIERVKQESQILKNQMKKKKHETQEKIQKIEKCFKVKQKLLSRLVSGKIHKLKQEHHKLKKEIEKQMLVFFKLTKLDYNSTIN